MAINAISYLTGSTSYQTGMFKRGTIGANMAPLLTGNFRWWNKVNAMATQYLIYTDSYTTERTDQTNSVPVCWSTPDLNDQSLVNLINTIPERVGKLPFTYSPVALQWIQSTGRYFLMKNEYENIVTNGLVLNLDAGWYDSYPATGTVWTDLSGSGNTGTLTNGPTFNTNNGGSIVFDGTDDYVIGNIASSTFSNASTICCWFKRSSVTQWSGLFSNNVNTFSSAILTFIDSTNIVGTNQVGIDGTNIGIDLGNDYLNQWIYCVIVYNGSTIGSGVNVYAYKNGNLLTSSGNLYWNLTTASQYYVGRHYTNVSQIHSGNIPIVQVYNRALNLTEITQNYNAQKTRFGFTADTIVTSGLTLNLDAGSVISYPTTGTSWYDTTGNNNNVTLNNGPTFSNSGTSSSIVFDGTDDYGIIPYNSAWDYSNNITLEAWVMVTTNSSNYLGIFGPFSQTPAYNGFNFSIPSGSGKLAFLVGGNGGAAYYVRQNTQYTLNTWYHLVGVINNGTSRLYVNGVLQDDSTSMTVAPPVGPFMLGKFYDGVNDYYFGGRIANGKFYNRVLSQSEITQNYNALKGRYGL